MGSGIVIGFCGSSLMFVCGSQTNDCRSATLKTLLSPAGRAAGRNGVAYSARSRLLQPVGGAHRREDRRAGDADRTRLARTARQRRLQRRTVGRSATQRTGLERVIRHDRRPVGSANAIADEQQVARALIEDVIRLRLHAVGRPVVEDLIDGHRRGAAIGRRHRDATLQRIGIDRSGETDVELRFDAEPIQLIEQSP